MTIDANVTFNSFEGGFWGLIAMDGKKYDPVNGLPADFQTEGLAVVADVEPADVVSTRMWGRSVFLKNISRRE